MPEAVPRQPAWAAHEAHAGVVGDEGVALGVGVVIEAIAVGPGDLSNDVGVDLMGQHQIIGGKADALAQDPVVFFHIRRIVATVHTKVHALKNAGADAAQTGGEAVGSLDAVGLQIFHFAVTFVLNRHGISPFSIRHRRAGS